ncbi:MAG: UbiA family prenyltransferase [Nocardioides sp.]
MSQRKGAPRAGGHSGGTGSRTVDLAVLTPVLLVRAAHPRQAGLTAVALALATAISGRDAAGTGLVLLTVLVGQAVLGWHNDLVDTERDRGEEQTTKPIANGRLDRGTVWFALICAVLLVVPLALSNDLTGGAAYLISLAVGIVGNLVLRRGSLSWLPWAVSFALYPAFLSYADWGGRSSSPPTIPMTVLAALLGVGVHVLCALPGLVADNRDGQRQLPLRLALKVGAPRLLAYSSAYCAVVVVLMAVTGATVGLSQ